MGFKAVEITLGSPVASPAGTVVFAYPNGTAQADFTGANANPNAYLYLNDNDRFTEAADEFDITYGASNITVTNKTGFTWPVGTRLGINLANSSPIGIEDLRQVGPVANIGDEPELEDVADKVNELLTALRASGLLDT